MINASSTLVEVAFEVCTALDASGYTAVLTGGSAATFYAPAAYVSRDLDFVITFRGAGGPETLERIGFTRQHDFYRHALSPFSLDFPPGPLAVGDDPITRWDTVRRDGQVLHVLSPFDSCRDRLASYLFWNDLNGLEQALAVFSAQRQLIELSELRSWATRERQATKFELFDARTRG